AALEQTAIDVHAPPSLPVVAVGNVELRPRIALCGIGALKRRARLRELLVAEKPQPIVEAHAIDRVGAERGRHAAGDLPERLRLSYVQPADEHRVDDAR